MIKTSIILFVLFYLVTAHSQQTIDRLNSNQLKLPKETISKALSIDATGQVKSSGTSDVELGYLSGVSSSVQDQIDDKANDADAVHLTGDESIAGVKTLTGKLVTSSTVNASIPCPVMTQTQRDAIATPSVGDCVFNSDTSLSNIYDGALWKAMGGSGGGIGLWVTANGYAIDDVVIESNNIYICLTAHTSGTFATDLAAVKWAEVSPYVDTIGVNLKSQNGASSLVQEIQVPNNQSTNTATDKFLLETGNSNILVNPNFSHASYLTGWDTTGDTSTKTAESTVVFSGLKSAKFVASSQVISLKQSSTLYAAQFADGVQGLASVRIKSNVALKVCSIQAGTVSTTNCVNVSTDNKWGLYKVPFILGATSNGISISSNGTSVSGTVYIDDAFVGAVDLKVDVDQSRIAGESYFAGTANCTWSRTSATLGAFTADADCPGPTITYSSMGTWLTTDSNLPRQSIDNLPAGTYEAFFNVPTYSTLNGANAITINDGTTTCVAAPVDSYTSNAQGVVSCTFVYTSSGNRVFELYGASTATTVNIGNETATIKNSKFTLKYFGSGSVYTSNNANYDWTPYTPTLSGNTNFGCNLQHMRNGASMKIKGTCTWTGAGNTAPPRFTLPNSLLTSFDDGTNININRALDSGIQDYGVVAFVSGTSGIALKREFIPLATNGSPVGTDNAFPFTPNTGDTAIINIEVPISTWNQSNIIIGSFNGLQSCADTLSCTDTFSAKVSAAGIVSNENIDWINGNASISSTSTYGITFNSSIFTVAPNCEITVESNASDAVNITPYIRQSATASGFSVRTVLGNNANAIASAFNIICQKQGADYIGKTAMAVASDQNLRSTGVTKGVIFSAELSASGVASNVIGGNITSATCSGGAFNVVLNGLSSAPNCTIGHSTSTNFFYSPSDINSSSTSLTFLTPNSTGTYACAAVFVLCHGVGN